MSLRNINKTELSRIISSSRSYRQALIMLGLVPAGGNYACLQKKIRGFNISTTHMTGQGWNQGYFDLAKYRRIPLNEILRGSTDYSSHKLKIRLINAGIKKALCELCGWCQVSVDGRIPIELDHINGDKRDNRLVNLRILCPNCHSLQTTHRGKNKGRLPG